MSGVLYTLVWVYALSCFRKLVLWSSTVHWWCCASRNVFSLVLNGERLGLIHPANRQKQILVSFITGLFKDLFFCLLCCLILGLC